MVYIGEKNPSGKIVKVDQLKPISGYYDYRTAGFEVRQNKYTPINDFHTTPEIGTGRSGIDEYWNSTKKSPEYLLGGKYEKLTGYVAADDLLKWTSYPEGYILLNVYTNNPITGGFDLVYTSPEIQFMKEPIQIEVPLVGVDRMYFELYNPASYLTQWTLPSASHFFNIELKEISK